MIAIIGAVALSVGIVLSFLILCGLPFGELTMGGKYKVFPRKLRIALIMQILLQAFFMAIVLQAGGQIPLWLSGNTTKIICIAMAIYLSINTVMNSISKSRKEKLAMTPLSAISAVCFWITALR